MKPKSCVGALAASALLVIAGCGDEAGMSLPIPGSRPAGALSEGPTAVVATDGTYGDRVGVGFDEVAGAVRYGVYRSEYPDGPFTRIGGVSSDEVYLNSRKGKPFYSDYMTLQGVYYYYAVTWIDDRGVESGMSAFDEGYSINSDAPGRVTGVSATDGSHADRVAVTWDVNPNTTHYRVFRKKGATETQVSGDVAGTSFDDLSVGPGLFSYRVVPYNDIGAGIASDYDNGHRAVSNQEFFVAYQDEMDYGLNRLTKLGGIGEETIQDENGNGTCHYKATGGLSGADVMITFTDFCDRYMTFNGSQHTVITDVFGQNGHIRDCQVNVTGIYNGYVRYDIIISGGAPSGGYYYVSQNGGPETQLAWNYYQP